MCSDVLKRGVRAVLDEEAWIGLAAVGAVVVQPIPHVVCLLLCEMALDGHADCWVEDCEHG